MMEINQVRLIVLLVALVGYVAGFMRGAAIFSSSKEVEQEQRRSVAPDPPEGPPDWHFTIGGNVE